MFNLWPLNSRCFISGGLREIITFFGSATKIPNIIRTKPEKSKWNKRWGKQFWKLFALFGDLRMQGTFCVTKSNLLLSQSKPHTCNLSHTCFSEGKCATIYMSHNNWINVFISVGLKFVTCGCQGNLPATATPAL